MIRDSMQWNSPTGNLDTGKQWCLEPIVGLHLNWKPCYGFHLFQNRFADSTQGH